MRSEVIEKWYRAKHGTIARRCWLSHPSGCAARSVVLPVSQPGGEAGLHGIELLGTDALAHGSAEPRSEEVAVPMAWRPAEEVEKIFVSLERLCNPLC